MKHYNAHIHRVSHWYEQLNALVKNDSAFLHSHKMGTCMASLDYEQDLCAASGSVCYGWSRHIRHICVHIQTDYESLMR